MNRRAMLGLRWVVVLELLGVEILQDGWASEAYLIELGWDIPNTKFLREQAASMEARSPFDGVMFHVEVTDETGRRYSTAAAWDEQPWKREWLQSALEDLQYVQWKKFRHNFVRFNATPGRLDWRDDVAWSALASKLGYLAWLVRTTGCAGIAFDFEHYDGQQFRWTPESGGSPERIWSLARRRGAELIRAMANEGRRLVVFTLFGLSELSPLRRDQDRFEALAGEPYGLLAPFLEGMLEAAPPEMVFVDGCERGYYLDGRLAYHQLAGTLRRWEGDRVRWLSPSLWPKYRAQMQVGFGIYLDMFVNEPTHVYYRPPRNGSRLARLFDNLSGACSAADRYVWLYGEQCGWWPEVFTPDMRRRLEESTVGRARHWEEALPGVTRALTWAARPDCAAAQDLALGGLTNLLANGDMSVTNSAGLPDRWGFWQAEGSRGTRGWELVDGNGRSWIAGARDACWIQVVPVVSSAWYVVTASELGERPGVCELIVRWFSGGKTLWAADQVVGFPGLNHPGSTRRLVLGVAPPDEPVDRIGIVLRARNQSAGERAVFDDVGVFAVPPPWVPWDRARAPMTKSTASNN